MYYVHTHAYMYIHTYIHIYIRKCCNIKGIMIQVIRTHIPVEYNFSSPVQWHEAKLGRIVLAP